MRVYPPQFIQSLTRCYVGFSRMYSTFRHFTVRPKTLFEKTRKEARKASKIHTGMSMTVPPPPRSATIAFEPRRASLPTSASTTAPSTSASPAHNMTLSPVRPISALPVRRPPAPSPAKDPLAKLFMPKHRAYSQLPQRT